MRMPIRRFAPIGGITLVIALVAATAFLAAAQDRAEPGPKICSTSAGDVSGEDPYLVENSAAMKKMMSDMAITPTGDVDSDFVAMMVPHHQGAIDMQRREFISLKQGGHNASDNSRNYQSARFSHHEFARGRSSDA